ncbi:MAG: adenylyltransferase/cytidyltransferase family protein [Candidatus Eremiobacteraeota bacterium]|uniref:Putative Cytidyltransferase with RfaE bifunctional protein, domain II n=1 Tax=mine drainage metagenome TaxID=410659 RepID=E6PGG5_9ZZZZ|nr:adenylyltransferase/cytidyltransferase family protein [Candidatus Eremiobacteraeota bacterium]
MPTHEYLFGRALELPEAIAYREMLRARNKTIVFTNGCFDVLHVGHAEYLAWARSQGDALIVGLNSDTSVRELKGAPRPFVPYGERARLLCALRSVDVVIGFSERTPEELLEHLRPDVHVKSAQYRVEDLPEARIVLAYGGEVRLAPHREGSSTTDIVERIGAHFTTER